MDKFIVRFSIIVLNLYMVVVTILAYNGIDISYLDYIFTDSALFGIVLTTLCHAQGRYHCVWMRALCYNLIFVPILNLVDYKYVLFETAEQVIYATSSIITLNVVATVILAINHFRRVRKVINKHRHE